MKTKHLIFVYLFSGQKAVSYLLCFCFIFYKGGVSLGIAAAGAVTAGFEFSSAKSYEDSAEKARQDVVRKKEEADNLKERQKHLKDHKSFAHAKIKDQRTKIGKRTF